MTGHTVPRRIARLHHRLSVGKPVQSVTLQLVHARVFDKPVIFCVNMDNDPIQRKHRKGGFYEQTELKELKAIFPEGGTFVDIGANVGNHSLFAAIHLAAGRVIPFEPNVKAFDLLCHNVLVNGLRDVIDLQFLGIGLSDTHAGGFAMEKRDSNLGGAKMQEGLGEIEVYRADQLLADVTPDMIKIDVEEMEMRVLAGLSGILSRCRPILLVEVDNINEAAFADWVTSNEYGFVSTHKRYRTNRNHIIADLGQIADLKSKIAALQEQAA